MKSKYPVSDDTQACKAYNSSYSTVRSTRIYETHSNNCFVTTSVYSFPSVPTHFVNRKFNGYPDKQGDLTGSVSTTSVTVTGVVECLQVCQEGSVRSSCKAVNYKKSTKVCELISQYALSVSEYSGYSYFELVTGACRVQYTYNHVY